ncbi:hypothetical protein QDY63_14885 [Pseudomonas brenneri]|uniref:hypothetical protein n=1 Tax=Pseudomonas brenneri TaxID=129817 RepID=UPI0025A08E8F|nr:hypothetical protein [Pseudomonas brenneri]WJM88686.1 hypothetical protein QDY63_14885 [Pseudomonas brenneri]
MTVAINNQLLNNIQECDVIPNFNKIEKKKLKATKLVTAKHALAVIATYVDISDDKLSREQIRRANRKPRKITHKTVEAREFLGIYN